MRNVHFDVRPDRELNDAPPTQPITGLDILEQEARRFLQLLDPTATVFTFQTAQDRAKGVKEGKPELARVFDDSTVDDPLLRKLYECGAAVWVTVNRTDLMGRKVRNVTHIRAVSSLLADRLSNERTDDPRAPRRDGAHGRELRL